MQIQKIGNTEIRKVSEIDRMALNADWLFPSIDPAFLDAQRGWLGPDFIDPVQFKLYLSFHTYVIRTKHHTILVDTCNGNHKQRPSMPAWTNLQTPYLENLAAIGVKPEEVDFVMCTHLHTDHVGWNTRLDNGRWVPTFPRARYIMGRVEYEHFNRMHQSNPETPVNRGSFVDSVLPVVEHGLAEFVEMDHVFERELGQDVWLSPACGHTPGHVFVHVGHEHGDHAVLTGDVIHHPVQFADPHLSNLADFDALQAYETRVGLMRRYADTRTKVLTGHFPSPTAGRIVSRGDEFRFEFEAI
ncbi:Beta-lactamase-like [Caballeronia glathei]|uniref:Beta-lactamase n=1 Tax=Caballeronia glathei TaxID=60547 RepID=A0A069PVB0_9BURK|nr:MBL fold metallo-hydrolase [Caballeronia glathei]KDR41266.1 beta-lactamase [Caballeronia glathei]CDY78519.1 Beta-lactamase-like [Caballeronia glathei]